MLNSIPSARHPRFGTALDLLGLSVWAGGLTLEVIADRRESDWCHFRFGCAVLTDVNAFLFRSAEKSAWREAKNEKKHDEKFIKDGVWSWSRHPK